jgi:hypothetical protein
MKSWFAKLTDVQILLAWLVLAFVAALIYFTPIARLIEDLTNTFG